MNTSCQCLLRKVCYHHLKPIKESGGGEVTMEKGVKVVAVVRVVVVMVFQVVKSV